MTKLRLVPYRELRRVAETAGFEWISRKGSHNKFRHPDGRVTIIPDHGSQVIVRPLLREILQEMGISPDDYERILDQK